MIQHLLCMLCLTSMDFGIPEESIKKYRATMLQNKWKQQPECALRLADKIKRSPFLCPRPYSSGGARHTLLTQPWVSSHNPPPSSSDHNLCWSKTVTAPCRLASAGGRNWDTSQIFPFPKIVQTSSFLEHGDTKEKAGPSLTSPAQVCGVFCMPGVLASIPSEGIFLARSSPNFPAFEVQMPTNAPSLFAQGHSQRLLCAFQWSLHICEGILIVSLM